MSSAPVETLVMRQAAARRQYRGIWSILAQIGNAIYPEEGRIKVPSDVMFFCFMLGLSSGMLGILMDLTVEVMSDVRTYFLTSTLRFFNETRPPLEMLANASSLGCARARRVLLFSLSLSRWPFATCMMSVRPARRQVH